MRVADSLAQDGYLILRGVLSVETIEAVRTFLTMAMNDHMAELAMMPKDTDLTFEQKQLSTGHFSLQTRLSQSLWAIPRDKGLRQVLQEAFASEDLYMHMPPTARFVLPGNFAAGVPPHQDHSYNEHLPDFVTVWVPLVEVDEKCGGVTMYEKSHHTNVDPGERNAVWYDAVPTENYQATNCVPMSPGDILIFVPTMIHGSMPNLSDRTRLSVDLRFFARPKSGKHFLDMQDWVTRDPNLQIANV